MNYKEFQDSRARVLYLLAVNKDAAAVELSRTVAAEALYRLGRETCPYTGQHFFDPENEGLSWGMSKGRL